MSFIFYKVAASDISTICQEHPHSSDWSCVVSSFHYAPLWVRNGIAIDSRLALYTAQTQLLFSFYRSSVGIPTNKFASASAKSQKYGASYYRLALATAHIESLSWLLVSSQLQLPCARGALLPRLLLWGCGYMWQYWWQLCPLCRAPFDWVPGERRVGLPDTTPAHHI